MYVDAREDRRLLAKVDLIKTATGRRRVSNPNPVVALNDRRLTDASKIPSKAYVEVDLPGLDGTAPRRRLGQHTAPLDSRPEEDSAIPAPAHAQKASGR